MILVNDRIYRAQEEKQVCFNRTVIGFIMYFSSDVGWAAVLGGQLPRTRAFVVLFNLTNYIILSHITYEWFMFMAASERMSFRTDRRKEEGSLRPSHACFHPCHRDLVYHKPVFLDR